MTITVQQPVISKPLRYVEDNNLDQTPVPMRICTVPVSFNGTVTQAVASVTAVDGTPIDSTSPRNHDAPLKWGGVIPGDSRTLVGGKTVNLGLFEIRADGVYLHTVSDTFPRVPVITEYGPTPWTVASTPLTTA